MSNKSSNVPAADRVFVSVSHADAAMLQDWAMCSPSMQQALRNLIATAHNARRGGGGSRRGDVGTLVVPSTSDLAVALGELQ